MRRSQSLGSAEVLGIRPGYSKTFANSALGNYLARDQIRDDDSKDSRMICQHESGSARYLLFPFSQENYCGA
jgi:hypothetical protein